MVTVCSGHCFFRLLLYESAQYFQIIVGSDHLAWVFPPFGQAKLFSTSLKASAVSISVVLDPPKGGQEHSMAPSVTPVVH